MNLDEKKDGIDKTIEVLEKLNSSGIDISNIKKRDTISDLCKKNGVEEEVISKYGIDISYRIGLRLQTIKAGYRRKK